MMCLLHMLQGPAACFTITSQTSSDSKFGKHSHKIQHRPGAQQWLSPVPLLPALPSITEFFACLLSIWQFWRLPEQYCSQEYHRGFSVFSPCQIKPAVFMTALREHQVLSTLHKMDKNSRRPKSPSYQTPVQFRRESCRPPIHTISEMRIVTSS